MLFPDLHTVLPVTWASPPLTCPNFQIALPANWSSSAPSNIPMQPHGPSLCFVHTHLEHAGVCNCNCVFVQNNYAVSTFWSPFPVRLAKGRNILCVYSRQMLSEWLPCFHYTLDVLFCALHNMHTHCWETKVTLWIRFLSARRSRSLRWGVNIFSSALLKLLIIYAFSPFIFKTF